MTCREGGEAVRTYYDDGQVRFLLGDLRDALRELPDESVQCVVTSPPYWSLRDYGVPPSVWGERDDVDGCPPHEWGGETHPCGTDICSRCGAWRGALGLEPTPEMYVEHMVEVFREVRRVLRRDGTLWLNLGDTYNAYNGNRGIESRYAGDRRRVGEPMFPSGYGLMAQTLKPKDLIGIPWRVAFALQSDGWYLRSDIIWAKPNPMPESVTDRPTKAHEYIFLLAKSERYYYDADAIREPFADERMGDPGPYRKTSAHERKANNARQDLGFINNGGGWTRGRELGGRNKRSVWTVATVPFPGAHFATFPPALVTPCILAGAPEGAVVLDPFLGSGTTAAVAKSLGRRAIGIDLNPAYLDMAIDRCRQLAMPMLGDAEVAVEGVS